MKINSFGKTIVSATAMLALLSAVPVRAQQTHGREEGSAAVIPEELPQIESYMLLNTGLGVSFGNVSADGYKVTGENGQACITPTVGFFKPIGPVMLMGDIANSMAFASPNSSNMLSVGMTPLLRIPQANLIVGTMLSLNLPFYDGRLISSPMQIPSGSPLPGIAGVGIVPGFRYNHTLGWGRLSGTFLFMTSRTLSDDDWNVGGSSELAVKTDMGVFGHIAPQFSLLEMGEKATYRYSSLRVQLGYANPERVPLMAVLSLYFPGSQENGFEKYGMAVVPAVTYMLHEDFSLWASVDINGVGSKDEKVGVVPQLGLELGIPFVKWASVIDAVENADSREKEQPKLHVGIAGGYTNNELYTSTAGRPFTEYESGDGFEVAVPVRYRFRRWFSIQGELQYIQKNYTMRRSGPYDGIYSDVTNGFIDVPLLTSFSFGGQKFRTFGNIGAYGGFWAYSHRKGTQLQFTIDPFDPDKLFYDNYDEKAEFDNNRDARFDGGALVGMGFQYSLPSCIFFVEGRYYHGLTDLQQNYGYSLVPRMNSTFNVRLGTLFNRNIFNRGD